jgi:hypothetical protein
MTNIERLELRLTVAGPVRRWRALCLVRIAVGNFAGMRGRYFPLEAHLTGCSSAHLLAVAKTVFFRPKVDFKFLGREKVPPTPEGLRLAGKEPQATWDQLVAAVLERQKMLPAGIAGTTAEKIADRVFAVTGRSVN